MIGISGIHMTLESIISQQPLSSIGSKIAGILSSSSKFYDFESISELKFELDLRENIIKAARELNKSKFFFKTFRESICNADYWNRTNEGGFEVKSGIKASEAIKDIFINGKKYGTECATAIVIAYYKALVELLPEERYNELFDDMYLMNWKVRDKDLEVRYYEQVDDFLPGDCRYFKNPDVDPLTPQWQGENAIDLGDGTYYGHGIGITNADGIIKALNKYRKSGATQSAYLLDSATRLILPL